MNPQVKQEGPNNLSLMHGTIVPVAYCILFLERLELSVLRSYFLLSTLNNLQLQGISLIHLCPLESIFSSS